MRTNVVAVLLLFFCLGSPTLGQQSKHTPLTNESIMGLVKIGFSDETILSMVEHEPGNYSLQTADLIALKKAGVSENVIRAMLSKPVNGQGQTAISPVSEAPSVAHAPAGREAAVNQEKPSHGSSVDPNIGVPTEPGLYAQLSEGALRHIAGRPTSFVRTGSRLASDLTAGIHANRMNTQIAGKSAYVTVGRRPTFYYRVAQNAPDQVVPGTLSLILTQMTVKSGRRQFELDANGVFRHSQGNRHREFV